MIVPFVKTPPRQGGGGVAPGSILFIGSAGALDAMGACTSLTPDQQIVTVSYEALTPDLLSRIAPDFVVSAMTSRGFDMLDICHVLHWAEFGGRYVVHCGDAPDTALLAREVREISRQLDVVFVTNTDLRRVG